MTEYNKLVRDRIPEIIKRDGQTPYTHITLRSELEKALTTALKKNQIAGAGLDVYEDEPHVSVALTRLPNTLLTPHTASATMEVRLQMSRDAAESIIAVLSGKKSKKTVNPEVYAK